MDSTNNDLDVLIVVRSGAFKADELYLLLQAIVASDSFKQVIEPLQQTEDSRSLRLQGHTIVTSLTKRWSSPKVHSGAG